MSPILIRGYFAINDVGILKIEENKQIKYKYFTIEDAQVKIKNDCDEINHFAYRGDDCKNSMLFIADDNKINVLRGIDFYKLAEIDCSIISKDTLLFNSDAGIIAVNETEVYLINKK